MLNIKGSIAVIMCKSLARLLLPIISSDNELKVQSTLRNDLEKDTCQMLPLQMLILHIHTKINL